MFLKSVLAFLYCCGIIFTALVVITNLRDKRANNEPINWLKVSFISLLIWVLSPLWMAWGMYEFSSIFIKKLRSHDNR